MKENAFKNLQNGGRGVGNVVESLLINPLSRYLFDQGIFENGQVEIKDINDKDFPFGIIV